MEIGGEGGGGQKGMMNVYNLNTSSAPALS